jgi:heme-degrading monooxygenase HmoA
MTYSIVRIDTGDYAKWRAQFDAVDNARRQFGATGKTEVFRDHENPNNVTVLVEWRDAKQAQEWFNSPALHDAQRKGGATQREYGLWDSA